MAFVTEYISSLSNFKTWFKHRIPDSSNVPFSPNAQQLSAIKTAEHANTPEIAHLNVQGQVFLTIANNKNESLETRLELDIEGNDLSITDPRGIKAFAHNFDMAGRKLRINSNDAGDKRLFLTVDNQSIYQWDANGHRIHTKYDLLRRPEEILVQNATNTFLVEKLIYGDARPQPETTNSRGMLWKHYDGAGLLINQSADFKGNLLEVGRKLLVDRSQTQPQWPQDSTGNFDEALAITQLEANTRFNTPAYTVRTKYDAMDRVIENELPDGSHQTPIYNPASLLEKLDIEYPGQNPEVLVSNIDYNAKGQREKHRIREWSGYGI